MHSRCRHNLPMPDFNELRDALDGRMLPSEGHVLRGENVMVAVNMATWPSDLIDHKMYCCPATESGFADGYRHYPAKYIANYVSKGAKYLGVVAACVHLRKDRPDRVLWKYDDVSDEDAITRAVAARNTTRRNPLPCLVFLESQLAATDFQYDKRGGLMSSCAYFDVSDLRTDSVKELAAELRELPWSGVPKRKP
jgi:hypothetical protein